MTDSSSDTALPGLGVADQPRELLGQPRQSDPSSSELGSVLEAVLLAADRPLPVARLTVILGLAKDADDADEATGPAEPSGTIEPPGDAAQVETKPGRAGRGNPRGGGNGSGGQAGGMNAAASIKGAIEHLNGQYAQTGRSFRIEQVAGGYRVMTLPVFADAMARLHASRAKTTLSQAALETLAILAYKQPITRAHLEAIRGVACGEVLRTLIDRKLVTIAGRAEELGRPMLYATTKRFLETFGLATLKDLPSVEELRAREAKAAPDGESGGK